MKGRRQAVPAQPRGLASGREHGDLEPWLEDDVALDTEPPDEVAVRRAAAQEDVLTVVEPQALLLDRERRAAEARTGLEERHRCACICAFEGRGYPRQPTSDHDDPPHVPAPTRLRAATQPFSQPGRESLPASTVSGSRSIRRSRRR